MKFLGFMKYFCQGCEHVSKGIIGFRYFLGVPENLTILKRSKDFQKVSKFFRGLQRF